MSEIDPESYNGGTSDNWNYWLKNAIYGVYADIPLEPDCDTIRDQLCRDLYYSSEGAAVDLADVSELKVFRNTDMLRLAPIVDSSQGVLCELLNPKKPKEEPELVMVCGTLFDLAIEIKRKDSFQFIADSSWPITSRPIIKESILKGRASILLNRRIATFGHLAIRFSYSPEEFREYNAHSPEHFQPRQYNRLGIDYKGAYRIRAVDNDVALLDKYTTGMVAIDHDGNTKEYGVVFNQD